MTQGYIIQAINTDTVDYQTCAQVLVKSLRAVGDIRPVTILTDISNDKVSSATYGPYADDWQVYEQSPYDETFKLEADMIVTRSLDSWWNSMKNRDLHIATGCRDYKQHVSKSRYYRQVFDKNNLPDVYNGITYFKKSLLSKQFFDIVKLIFENWQEINNNLSYSSELTYGDTDTVYAIAANIIGIEQCTIPNSSIQFVHMKQRIHNGLMDDWTKEMIWELIDSDFRINTISQLYPVHYHIKSLASDLELAYDIKI
jgi:hypothetical protein